MTQSLFISPDLKFVYRLYLIQNMVLCYEMHPEVSRNEETPPLLPKLPSACI